MLNVEAGSSASEAAISKITNLEWTGLGRAADLVWLTFGSAVKWRNYKGELVDRSQYALHLQCPFRISLQGTAKLGSSDVSLSADDQVADSSSLLPKKATAFDVKAAAITSDIGLSKVASAAVSGLGDIYIGFENGLVLETLAVASDDSESWRIISFEEPRFEFVFPDT